MSDRKIPVNWTIDKEVWEAIQQMVAKATEAAGVQVSASAIANQLLKQGLDQKNKSTVSQ